MAVLGEDAEEEKMKERKKMGRKQVLNPVLALVIWVMTLFNVGCGGAGSGDGESEGDPDPPPPIVYQLYGSNFSPYEDGQDPNRGAVVSADQVERRMRLVAPHTKWVRTFGCTRGLEHAGAIAHRLQLKIAMGAWIGGDLAANETEMGSLIREALSGNADLAVIGTEVLFRGDLPAAELIAHIRRFRREVPGVPVTTADTYADILANPEVMAECDVIMANYYPYWEGEDVSRAVAWLHARHRRLVAAAGVKEVLVAETGWPSAGDTIADAAPSPGNAAFYFQNFVSWARAEGVGYFYFEALDEKWKAAYEGPQGAHWGLWKSQGTLKPGMHPVFDGETVEDNWTCGDVPGGAGAAEIELTAVPLRGSFIELRGLVWHVAPGDHGVAVYIRASSGWWTKPYFSAPVTPINCDGTWGCDVTTGGADELATHIAAFLIPLGYSPPAAAGSASLPGELFARSLAFVQKSRE
jgi:exo-beta-1,3-glucanase (GH17 family)